tara:strand:+ start:2809 stop:3375 length:567 start_codon:yes stop_codon:yes gene_type:complete
MNMIQNNYLQNVVAYPNFLDEDKIKDAIENTEYIGYGLPEGTRICKIHSLNNLDSIMNHINKFIHRMNNRYYHFDIVNIQDIQTKDHPRRFEYKSTENGKFDQHIDVGDNRHSTRKLSYSIQLTDSNDYEGGDLIFWPQGNNTPELLEMRRQKGTIIIFPSYMCHAVTPVTKGVRNALVGWVHGNAFR